MIELLLASQFFSLYSLLFVKHIKDKHNLPLLSEQNSKELLKELLSNGMYKANELRSMGIRNCDIIACKKERIKLRNKKHKTMNKKNKHDAALRKLNESIDKRNKLLIHKV